jgi:hypothetical protein
VVERPLHTRKVAGSNPAPRTIFPEIVQIGDEHDFLRLEVLDLGDPFSCCRLEAKSGGSGYEFSARHDGVMLDTSEGTLTRLLEFEGLAVNHFELPISEGGWIRVIRDSRGHLTVRYRIARLKLAAVMEGEVYVHGEHAAGFCRELRAVLQAKA